MSYGNISTGSIITIVPFGLVYIQGIRGTMHYHKNKKTEGNKKVVEIVQI